MPVLLTLINHDLLPEQESDARLTLGISSIVTLPDALKRIWRLIPAGPPQLHPFLAPILQWISAFSTLGDYVLVQGDVGACFIIARFCLEQGRVPIYATGNRVLLDERRVGSEVETTRRFGHVAFRRYGA